MLKRPSEKKAKTPVLAPIYARPFSELDMHERTSLASGMILVGIGDGNFRSAVTSVLLMAHHAAYDLAYRKGFADAKREVKRRKRR